MDSSLKATSYQPGEWVEEKKAIFIGEFDDLIRADIPVPLAHTAPLGLRTRWYDAALDLKPDTFDNCVKTIAALNVNGRTGIGFDPAAYEEQMFNAIRSGEAVGKFVIAPLAVIDEIHLLKKKGEYKRRKEGNLPGALRVDGGGTGYDRWQWSASMGRYGDEYIRIVDFTDGYHGWDFRSGNLLSVRACFCEVVQTDGDKSAKTRTAWAPPASTTIKSSEETNVAAANSCKSTSGSCCCGH